MLLQLYVLYFLSFSMLQYNWFKDCHFNTFFILKCGLTCFLVIKLVRILVIFILALSKTPGAKSFTPSC